MRADSAIEKLIIEAAYSLLGLSVRLFVFARPVIVPVLPPSDHFLTAFGSRTILDRVFIDYTFNSMCSEHQGGRIVLDAASVMNTQARSPII